MWRLPFQEDEDTFATMYNMPMYLISSEKAGVFGDSVRGWCHAI
jgi:hypothetical protein